MAQIMQEWANSLNLKEFYKEMARMRKSSLKKNIPEGNNMVKVIDYTEQLMKFIQFFPADDQGEYSISLRDVTNSNKVSYIPRKFTSEQFRKAIGWLAVQNSKGYNVYFRVPNDPHYIVIDDILDDSKVVKDNLTPHIAVETSPNNHQFWYVLPQKYDENQCRLIQKQLVSVFNGDKAAVGIYRNGRLPFFANKKANKHNFVTKLTYMAAYCRVDFDKILKDAMKSEEVRAEKIQEDWQKRAFSYINAIKDQEKAYKIKNLHDIFTKAWQNNFLKTHNHSQAEIAGAIAALGNGASREEVISYIEETVALSDRIKASSYAENTVTKALQYIGNISRMQ